MSQFAAIMSLVGMATSFIGKQQEGKAQAAAYNMNASIARQQASMAAEKGKLEAYRQRKKNEAFSARQRALFSKANVQFVGSPLEVLASDAADMELDAIILEYNAEIERSAFMSEAEYNEFLARESRRSSQVSAWGSLLTSMGSYGLSGGFGSTSTVPRSASYPSGQYGTISEGGVPMSGYF